MRADGRGKLLTDEHPLQVLPKLACIIGLNEVIALQQTHYLLGEFEGAIHNGGGMPDGTKWIRMTDNEWLAQFPFWSRATLKRTVSKLIALGLLKKSHTKGRGAV